MSSTLFRGIWRSRQPLRSTAKAAQVGASRPKLDVGAGDLNFHHETLSQRCSDVFRRHYFSTLSTIHVSEQINPILPLQSNISIRLLSSLKPDTVQNDQGQDFKETEAPGERRPSALEKANIPVLTPGLAIGVLQRFAANGSARIRLSDFYALCESSRPGKQRDAKVIATALREFKRNNRFRLDQKGAKLALEGMLRSMTPNYKTLYGKLRLEAALFVLQQFLDETTGLYFASDSELLDDALNQMHQSLIELQERGVNVKIFTTEKRNGAEESENESREVTVEDNLVKDADRVTRDLIKLLVKRMSHPEGKMKKRAKRKYLKHLRVEEGPAMSTLAIASKIYIMTSGAKKTKQNIISPYTICYWAPEIDASIIQIVNDAKKKEANKKKALEEAPAAEETSGSDLKDNVEEDIVDDKKDVGDTLNETEEGPKFEEKEKRSEH